MKHQCVYYNISWVFNLHELQMHDIHDILGGGGVGDQQSVT